MSLREIAETAGRLRAEMSEFARDYYGIPPAGAFVGEHTGFVVIPHEKVLALLDVAEAAQEIASPGYLEQPGPYATGIRRDEAVALTEAFYRLREATS